MAICRGLLYVDWIEERALSLTASQQVVSNERLKSNFPLM